MKFSKIAIAAATLVATVGASAAPSAVAYSAGASAIQANLRSALASLCTATNPGYVLSALRAAAATNDNFVSYVCASGAVTAANYATATYGNFSAGIPFQEIRLNVDQGSFSAIQQVNDVSLAYYNPATGANFTPAPASITKLGGALDVQPEAFPASVIGSLVIPPTSKLDVAQAFGVGVSRPLYQAMYAAQLSTGAATVMKPIPASCGNNALTVTGNLECVPSISKGQMATIMADNSFNSAYTLGAEFLGAAANIELGYARRVDTSGTQAAAQNYFLGNPCSAAPVAVVAQGNGTTGTLVSPLLRVYGMGSTGNVRTVLNDTTKYTIGVVSGENNQTGQAWYWLRVQGSPMAENSIPASAGITNRDAVIKGTYDFFYETVYASGGAAGDAFWADVKTAISGLALPLGVGLVDGATLAAGYNKGGLSCQFNSSN